MNVDGRRFAPSLVVKLHPAGDHLELCAPMPGWLRDAAAPGSRLVPGMMVGELEVLGVRHRLLVPEGASGLVEHVGARRLARRAVAYGEALVRLDPRASGGDTVSRQGASGATEAAGLSFNAPMSGRYYARPAPDSEPFVKPGDVIERGRTVALLEVMKTFNRVQYSGATLPERARVVKVLRADGEDVNGGDAILELEPA